MSPTHYQVVVIGAGPAGYAAALRCAQLGLHTACLDNWCDKDGRGGLGGFYLNAGCVAYLALLESAKLYASLSHTASAHGISADAIRLDWAQALQRKDKIIEDLRADMATAFAAQKIDLIHARGRLLNPHLLEVQPVDRAIAFYTLTADHVILATGSLPSTLRCAPIDRETIIDALSALNLPAVPKKLAIIGAGVIGLELAGLWNRLGSETVLLEAREQFLPMLDKQVAEAAYSIYSAQGLNIRLGARVIATRHTDKQVSVDYQTAQGLQTLQVDKVIVAAGIRPNSEHLAAPEANLLLDENGYVHVDDYCRTNLPHVYAIGDLSLLGPLLAHKGIEEGLFVAEHIAGQQNEINYATLPSVIYTEPEIAWVGQSEQALRASGEPFKIGVAPLAANARAQAAGHAAGLVKIIAHAETDALLGVHILGANASELIAEAVLALEFSASSEDLARTIHAHPTLSESVYAAAWQVKRA